MHDSNPNQFQNMASDSVPIFRPMLLPEFYLIMSAELLKPKPPKCSKPVYWSKWKLLLTNSLRPIAIPLPSANNWVRLFATVYFFVLLAAEGNAAANTTFWLEPRSNVVFDNQVINELSSRAGQIVLRANRNNAIDTYALPAIVSRLKEKMPKTPVLAYAWATRFPEKGRTEFDLLKGSSLGTPLAEIEDGNQGKIGFLDITALKVRTQLIKRLVDGSNRLGADGLAIDLALRTPTRPKPLAKLCRQQIKVCANYPKGMDALFTGLRATLGKDRILVYNGLFNAEPGQIEDQAKLLEYADAAAIEYFGLNPNEKNHGFSNDILPYLKTLPFLPGNKFVHVFARGPWTYTDYVNDYRWQRYLYASFLLVRREGDLFKYHASFQVPAHKGRSGGLDVYADWNVKLGQAMGPYSVENGLYRREFERGLIVVSPDDGQGGDVTVTGTKYSFEGESLTGKLHLPPGHALIALNDPDHIQARPVAQVYSAQSMASWGWSNAELKKASAGDFLKLDSLSSQLEGNHDLLLDYERSLTPFQQLEIKAKLIDSKSALLAIVEIDDPNRQFPYVIVEINENKGKNKKSMREAVDFRSPPKKRNQAAWPRLHIQYAPDNRGNIVLDGTKLLREAGYRFRRWSHLRFAGSVEVSRVALGNPIQIR